MSGTEPPTITYNMYSTEYELSVASAKVGGLDGDRLSVRYVSKEQNQP